MCQLRFYASLGEFSSPLLQVNGFVVGQFIARCPSERAMNRTTTNWFLWEFSALNTGWESVRILWKKQEDGQW